MSCGAARTILKGIVILAVVNFTDLGFSALGQPVNIILPTENHGLLSGDNAAFYQYVKRDFEGVTSTPWEGGQYGFVRNPRRFGTTVLETRFHEGIDIRPLQRDARGEPLDVIHAIAAGKVDYINNAPGGSNYGRYVVIEHLFGGCPYYSLYAHLSAVRVNIGDQVSPRRADRRDGTYRRRNRPGAISCSPRIEPPLEWRLCRMVQQTFPKR